MEGMGRGGVLGVESPDPVLSFFGALGLGASAGTALVIDVTGDCRVATGRTLVDLIENGPSLAELSPTKTGVAVIGGGAIEVSDGIPLIERLRANWPAVVVRCDP